MIILFATGDVGGARAMSPVIEEAAARGCQCFVLANGAIVRESGLNHASVKWVENSIEPSKLVNETAPDVVCFASSVKDLLPLQIAESARMQGIPTAHLLDSWCNYEKRLQLDAVRKHVPDLYAVMDDKALAAAIKSGITKNVLVVTGSPAFSHLPEFDRLRGIRKSGDCSGFIFVSEPVCADEGENIMTEGHRGYTEKSVLREVMNVFGEIGAGYKLQIFPHPREDVAELADYCNAHQANASWEIVSERSKPQIIKECAGVIGMASVLLYQSWLAGIPVLSLQPGLKKNDLTYLDKEGIRLVTEKQDVSNSIKEFVKNNTDPQQTGQKHAVSKSERALHMKASKLFLKAIEEIANAN